MIDNLVIAAGVNYLYTDATLESKINLSSFGLSDANRQLEGDGTAWGYNLGILLRLGEKLSIGASYRSKMDLDMKGEIKIELQENPPDFLTTVFPSRTGVKATLKLPPQVFYGIAFKPVDKLLIEIGGAWEGR